MEYELYPLGEDAVLIELGKEINSETHHWVQIINRSA